MSAELGWPGPVAQWISARRPHAPPALAASLSRALAPVDAHADSAVDAERVAAACLRAAERTLSVALAEDTTGRGAALDLLTADALVTYAFEAASEVPDRLGDLARDAMARLSRAGVP